MASEYGGLTGWLYSMNETDPILLGLLILVGVAAIIFIIAWLGMQ